MILEVENYNSGKYVRVYDRATCSYVDLTDKFRLKSKEYARQFAHIYAVRLFKMRDVLIRRAKQKWGSDVAIRKLFELREEDNEKCVVIGTLFKQQEFKPNILKEISEEHNLLPQPPRSNFSDESDILILEDELQRIRLVGDVDVHNAVTGILCAVYGNENEDGQFVVEDYCWAGPPERTQSEVPRNLSADTASYILLVSGLDVSSVIGDSLLPMQMLADWVTGMVGDPNEQEQQQCKIARIFIAGNSVSGKLGSKSNNSSSMTVMNGGLGGHHGVTGSLNGLKLLDDFLTQLVASVPVDLMPGEFDPSNHMMPQQPLHRCMLPQSSCYPTLNGVTNPHKCIVGEKLILGSSGQPVDDIGRFSKLDDPISILKNTIKWCHLAPTCPDTLPCYPFYDDDPFVIDKRPDIYFSGNQNQFQTELFEGIRIVCIPEFSVTKTAVLVNLLTLDCQPISFSVDT